ncbi:unnamed protein product [Amoebophrya sp. A120]|nr:unnamed protein product [Amoebophrya sp. A120]|eukprot:GSA120T00005153001.1
MNSLSRDRHFHLQDRSDALVGTVSTKMSSPASSAVSGVIRLVPAREGGFGCEKHQRGFLEEEDPFFVDFCSNDVADEHYDPPTSSGSKPTLLPPDEHYDPPTSSGSKQILPPAATSCPQILQGTTTVSAEDTTSSSFSHQTQVSKDQTAGVYSLTSSCGASTSHSTAIVGGPNINLISRRTTDPIKSTSHGAPTSSSCASGSSAACNRGGRAAAAPAVFDGDTTMSRRVEQLLAGDREANVRKTRTSSASALLSGLFSRGTSPPPPAASFLDDRRGGKNVDHDPHDRTAKHLSGDEDAHQGGRAVALTGPLFDVGREVIGKVLGRSTAPTLLADVDDDPRNCRSNNYTRHGWGANSTSRMKTSQSCSTETWTAEAVPSLKKPELERAWQHQDSEHITRSLQLNVNGNGVASDEQRGGRSDSVGQRDHVTVGRRTSKTADTIEDADVHNTSYRSEHMGDKSTELEINDDGDDAEPSFFATRAALRRLHEGLPVPMGLTQSIFGSSPITVPAAPAISAAPTRPQVANWMPSPCKQVNVSSFTPKGNEQPHAGFPPRSLGLLATSPRMLSPVCQRGFGATSPLARKPVAKSSSLLAGPAASTTGSTGLLSQAAKKLGSSYPPRGPTKKKPGSCPSSTAGKASGSGSHNSRKGPVAALHSRTSMHSGTDEGCSSTHERSGTRFHGTSNHGVSRRGDASADCNRTEEQGEGALRQRHRGDSSKCSSNSSKTTLDLQDFDDTTDVPCSNSSPDAAALLYAPLGRHSRNGHGEVVADTTVACDMGQSRAAVGQRRSAGGEEGSSMMSPHSRPTCFNTGTTARTMPRSGGSATSAHQRPPTNEHRESYPNQRQFKRTASFQQAGLHKHYGGAGYAYKSPEYNSGSAARSTEKKSPHTQSAKKSGSDRLTANSRSGAAVSLTALVPPASSRSGIAGASRHNFTANSSRYPQLHLSRKPSRPGGKGGAQSRTAESDVAAGPHPDEHTGTSAQSARPPSTEERSELHPAQSHSSDASCTKTDIKNILVDEVGGVTECDSQEKLEHQKMLNHVESDPIAPSAPHLDTIAAPHAHLFSREGVRKCAVDDTTRASPSGRCDGIGASPLSHRKSGRKIVAHETSTSFADVEVFDESTLVYAPKASPRDTLMMKTPKQAVVAQIDQTDGHEVLLSPVVAHDPARTTFASAKLREDNAARTPARTAPVGGATTITPTRLHNPLSIVDQPALLPCEDKMRANASECSLFQHQRAKLFDEHVCGSTGRLFSSDDLIDESSGSVDDEGRSFPTPPSVEDGNDEDVEEDYEHVAMESSEAATGNKNNSNPRPPEQVQQQHAGTKTVLAGGDKNMEAAASRPDEDTMDVQVVNTFHLSESSESNLSSPLLCEVDTDEATLDAGAEPKNLAAQIEDLVVREHGEAARAVVRSTLKTLQRVMDPNELL